MWAFRLLEEIENKDLFKIFKLRVDTFVVEQKCFYEEIDDQDLTAVHFFKKDGEEIAAYGRLIIDKDTVHIGRVIVAQKYRGHGLGREIMQQALQYIETHHPFLTMHLQGQAHLEQFYGSFGFNAISDVYFVDMIPHIDMERAAFGQHSPLKGA